MKFIAFYLPQFHEIPENNEMWGKGFTEWTNVKKAKPLFDGHFQPVEPLDDYYYDLTDISTMKWQIELAKKYGIYGFCFYHYWYNGHMLLEKPVNAFLKDKSLDLPFCICWANHDWTFSWVGKESTVIYSQDYRDKKEWKKHFEYFCPFFKDDRYIRIDGRPLLVIYEPYKIMEMNQILQYWNDLAKKEGLPGLAFAYQSAFADMDNSFDNSIYDFDIEYQPQYARVFSYQKKKLKFRSLLRAFNDKFLKLDWNSLRDKYKTDVLTKFDYDDLWEKILNTPPINSKSIPGAFVNVDTTPRKHERGIVSIGMDPGKLEKYLESLIIKTKKEYKKDMIFVYAWNEWAEGAYMEPDKRWGYRVLEAFRDAMIKTNELPN